MWTARVRTAAHALTEPFLFSELTLVERYGPPDSLVISGQIEDLRPAFDLNSGIVVWDETGRMRFSGVPPQPPKPKLERRGDGTAVLAYESDLVHFWDRLCWPSPSFAWSLQTTAYDVQTAVHEDRIIGYATRNAGSIAFVDFSNDRRIPHIRFPTSLGRGTSDQTSARFQNLGALVAELAEAANLRVTIQQTYTGTTPFLDVVIDGVPDLSDWSRFGDATSGTLGFLAPDWRYAIGTGASVILSAAGGELENRLLDMNRDNTREVAQGRRIEIFLDQRDTELSAEINQGMATAMAENAPTVEAEAPIIAGNFEFGPGAGNIPVGAEVTVSLDGELVVDRIRQITTTVANQDGQATITVEPIFGSPDAGLTIEQKFLRRAARRLTDLERSL
jgi:hypothetical protein